MLHIRLLLFNPFGISEKVKNYHQRIKIGISRIHFNPSSKHRPKNKYQIPMLWFTIFCIFEYSSSFLKLYETKKDSTDFNDGQLHDI